MQNVDTTLNRTTSATVWIIRKQQIAACNHMSTSSKAAIKQRSAMTLSSKRNRNKLPKKSNSETRLSLRSSSLHIVLYYFDLNGLISRFYFIFFIQKMFIFLFQKISIQKSTNQKAKWKFDVKSFHSLYCHATPSN